MTTEQEEAVGTAGIPPKTPEPSGIGTGAEDAEKDTTKTPEPFGTGTRAEDAEKDTAKTPEPSGTGAEDAEKDTAKTPEPSGIGTGDVDETARTESAYPNGITAVNAEDGAERAPGADGTEPSGDEEAKREDGTAFEDRGDFDSELDYDAGEIVLEAVGLTKIYRSGFGLKKTEVVALKNVGFTVRAGEVVGFLGPNGAGKSTAIKLVTGLASMTAGSVKILGRDVRTDRKAALAAVGGVIEQPDLYADMTAVELMRYFASLYPDAAFRDAEGVAPKEKKENRIGSLLKLVGLESRKNDKIKTYSLGMKQRLGIAQALVNKPRLLLLDEPANGLDPAGIKDVRDVVRRLAHELGMAVLVSSHQLQEMQQMCDRVVILYRGVKAAEGKLRELLKNVSKRRIRIATPEPKRAAECFAESEGVAAIAEAGGILLSGEIAAGDAAKTLVLAGVPFTGIAEEAATLEEFFFRMTKEEPER